MNRADVESLDREGLIRVALAQGEAIDPLNAKAAALEAEIAELRGKLDRPPKTPDNSSVPPSRGQKKTTALWQEEEAASGRASAASSRSHASARCARECVWALQRRRLGEPTGALPGL